MLRILFFLVFFSSLYAKEQVVLIHGFMRTSWSMVFLANWLEKQGYAVHNFGYPSRAESIEAHGEQLAKFLQKIDRGKPLFFITHSMGACVLEVALHHHLTSSSVLKSKAILLAPPHQGSCLARGLKKYPWIRAILGKKAGAELLDLQPGEWEQKFPPIEGFSMLILSGRRDKKVLVHESCLFKPHLHDIVNSGHTFIMNSKEVKRAIKLFFTRET